MPDQADRLSDRVAARMDRVAPGWKGAPPPVPLLAQRRCPWCGAMIEASTGIVDGLRPKPGDCSVCFGCTRLGVFYATGPGTLELRRATPTETARFLEDAAVGKMLQQARAAPLRKVESYREARAHVERWRDGLLLDAAGERLARAAGRDRRRRR
jgi:hypothetical protein